MNMFNECIQLLHYADCDGRERKKEHKAITESGNNLDGHMKLHQM